MTYYELYNMTALKESKTIVDIVIAANKATDINSNTFFQGGFLVGGLFVIIFGVLFTAFVNISFSKRLIVSSFICLILSIFARAAELVGFIYVLVFLILLCLGLGLSVVKPDSYGG